MSSWADLARKAKNTEVDATTSVPKQIVIAPETHSDSDSDVDSNDDNTTTKRVRFNRDLNIDNIHQLTVADIPPHKKGVLVLDTNALIKGMDNLVSLADVFITVPQVLQEVKDRHTRDFVDRLPIPLTVLDPSKTSMARVMDFSEQTGDFGAMSRTDVRVCALALECCEALKCMKASIVPRRAIILGPSEGGAEKSKQAQAQPGGDDEDDEAVMGNQKMTAGMLKARRDKTSSDVAVIQELVDEPQQHQQEEEEGDEGNEQEGSDADDGDDDDDGWITTKNIAQVSGSLFGTTASEGADEFTGGCACVTTDFPMQNVLLHLGVPIIGVRGMKIRELRLWLLRCHACYAVMHDTSRQFCSECGSGNTLKRVNYAVGDDGSKKLFVNFRKRIATRGTVYNLPNPRGGRKGTNKTLALREDQLAHITHPNMAANALKKKQIEADDDLDGFGEVKHSRFNPDKPRVNSSYKRYNVIEKKKQRASRRK